MNLLEFAAKYWLEALFGLVLWYMKSKFEEDRKEKAQKEEEYKKRKELQDLENKKIKEGLVAILHDRLFQSCMYFIDQGEIPLGALDNINEMYKPYKALGGNGTGTEIVERANDLPIKK